MQVKVWEQSMIRSLIAEDYPWFLSAYNAQSGSERAQADSARMFILHKHGGVCINRDVQCFDALDATLGQFDLVLQVCLVALPSTFGIPQ